jgi:hypothetical protein
MHVVLVGFVMRERLSFGRLKYKQPEIRPSSTWTSIRLCPSGALRMHLVLRQRNAGTANRPDELLASA